MLPKAQSKICDRSCHVGEEDKEDEVREKRRIRVELDGQEFEGLVRAVIPERPVNPPLDLSKPICNRSDNRHWIKIFCVTENYIYGAWRADWWLENKDYYVPHRWRLNGSASNYWKKPTNGDLINCEPSEDRFENREEILGKPTKRKKK